MATRPITNNSARPLAARGRCLFLSYRRSDAAGYAGRISERLQKEFGRRRLFQDIESIRPGSIFGEVIQSAISSSGVFLALIGPDWLEARDKDGNRRLDDPSDYVRLEISAALRLGISIVPVLINGAALPPPERLPADLKPLVEYEAHELTDKRWAYDLDQLVGILRDILNPGWRKRRIALKLVAVLLIIAAMVASYRPLISHLSRIPRLAIVDPTNNTGDSQYQFLSVEMGDTLRTSMAIPKKLNAVPPDEILTALEEFSVLPDECSKRVDPGPIRDMLGAAFVVFGDFRFDSQTKSKAPRVTFCLKDSYGNLIDKMEENVLIEEIPLFTAKAASRFRAKIAHGEFGVEDFKGIYPEDQEARRFYFTGLSQLRALNARDAVDSLRQAARREDENALIHAAIADAWAMLRHDDQAKLEAKEAVDRSNNLSVPLPIEYRDGIKARSAEINKNWDLAAEYYDSLYGSFPQRLDYGLKLAAVRTAGSHPKQALSTLDKLSKLPSPLGEDPRIFIEQSRAFEALGDSRGAVRAAQRAVIVSESRKWRLLNGVALLQLCWAHRELADKSASSDCERAQRIFDVFGNEVLAAVALNDLATWLTDRQRYEEANLIYDRVIEITDRAQAMSDLTGALLNSARVFLLQGYTVKAQPLLKRALSVSIENNDKYDQLLAQVDLAELHWQSGDIAESGKQATEARDLARITGDRSLEAYALLALALAQTEAGNLKEALDNCNASLKIRQNLQEQNEIAIAWTRIADVYYRRRQFDDAEKKYRDALDAFGKLQRPDEASQTELDLAQLYLEEARFSEAQAQAATAFSSLDKNDTDSQADVLSLLVRALLGQGNLEEARKYYSQMKDMRRSDPDVAIDIAWAAGQYNLASGDPQSAVKGLDKAAEEAKASNRQFGALQLLLVEVSALRQLGNRKRANQVLTEIRASASRCSISILAGPDCGFNLIENKALALMRSQA